MFPLVHSAALSRPPSKSDIIKALSICSTPEGAAYLHQRVEELYQRSKNVDPEAANQLLDILSTNAKNLKSIQEGKGMVWEGRSFGSDFELIQKQEAMSALKTLKDESMPVECLIAISAESEILRSYASNGNAMDEAKVAALDKLLNAYLSQHHMLTKDGVIYQEENGDIKSNNGQPERANVAEIKKILLDTKNAFSSYVKSNAKSVDFKVDEAEFPAKTKEQTPSQST